MAFYLPAGRLALITAFIEYCSIGLLMPVMPILLTKLSPSVPVAVVVSGATLAGVGICQFVTAPIIGRLADHFGCRPVLIASLASSSCALLVTATSSLLWAVVFSRLLTGIVQHSILLANVLITETAQGKKLSERLSQISAASGIGYVLGSLFSGLSSELVLNAPIVFAALLTAGNAVIVFRCLGVSPLTLHARGRSSQHSAQAKVERPGAMLAYMRSISAAIFDTFADQKTFVFILVAVGYYITLSVWPIFTMIKFGWHSKQLGGSLFLYGIMLLISQGWLAGRLLQRFTPLQIAKAAIISSSVAAVLYGIAPTGVLLMVIMVLNLCGYLAEPMLRTFISSSYPLCRQGEVMGKLGASTSIGIFLGPVLGTIFLVPYSIHGSIAILSLLPFGLASAMFAAAACMLWHQ